MDGWTGLVNFQHDTRTHNQNIHAELSCSLYHPSPECKLLISNPSISHSPNLPRKS